VIALLLAAAAAIAPTFQYFAGTSTISGPDGRVYGKSETLIERVVDPAREQIIERVLAPDRKHPGRFQEFIVDMRVDALRGELVMQERGNAFKGDGKLMGDLWGWNAWQTTSLLPDGTRVEARDRFDNGVLIADKQVLSADGKLQVKVAERHQPIDAAEYERRYFRLMVNQR
jgi:hypothetical protein